MSIKTYFELSYKPLGQALVNQNIFWPLKSVNIIFYYIFQACRMC